MYKNVYIKVHPIAGRCVFAAQDFKKGDLIAENQVLLVTYSKIESSELDNYAMAWDDQYNCIALGPINLLSHSARCNCSIENDHNALVKRIRAARDIARDEHLTIDYDCELWFDPLDIANSDFSS
jgi:SET domain-containing protein